MGHKTTLNYLQKIRDILPEGKFQEIAEELFCASSDELESFWNIMYAGYSVEFAISNYKHLFDYIKDKDIKYADALKIVYTFYPGLDAGIFIKHPEWFEFN